MVVVLGAWNDWLGRGRGRRKGETRQQDQQSTCSYLLTIDKVGMNVFTVARGYPGTRGSGIGRCPLQELNQLVIRKSMLCTLCSYSLLFLKRYSIEKEDI